MKFEARTYLQVDSDELDNMISKEFGFEGTKSKYGFITGRFESIAAEEWNNNSYYVINVDGVNDEWDQETVDKRKNSYGAVGAYMNDMAKRNIIPVGDYLVKVFW